MVDVATAAMRAKIERMSMPEPNSGCWLWLGTASRNRTGLLYPMVRDGGMRRANRASFEAFNRPIASGQVVRHTCDNPMCVNPGHLVIGTQADNVRDRYDRGRARHLVGSNHPNSRLTEAAVREIRALASSGVSARKIASIFGVSLFPVQQVIRRKAWKHVYG